MLVGYELRQQANSKFVLLHNEARAAGILSEIVTIWRKINWVGNGNVSGPP